LDIIGQILQGAWNYFKRALSALRHLHFADIWHAIQRGYDRFHRALQWYNDHVIKPLERMRQQLIALYNRYLGPVIKLLDTVRATVRIVAIFNRKLAAQIDQALWQVESALYAPLYSALRRLNAITSTIRAIITPLGLIDRQLLILSMQRDWKSIWRVLLNNGKLPVPRTVADPLAGLHQLQVDFKEMMATNTGPVADRVRQLETAWPQIKAEIL